LLPTAAVTIVPAAYAEEEDHDDDNGDGNKIKADESQVAVADCDNNEVEQAGFDCIAIEENRPSIMNSIPPNDIETAQ
jgi:hypothetical protein